MENGWASITARICTLTCSSASMSCASTPASSDATSRSIPASAMKRRYPSVVSAKPGGTRTPALINSPREEHLPPTRGTDSLRQSSNQQTIGRPGRRVFMASAGVSSITLAALAICAGQRVMVIAPVEPSTRSIMPVLMILVACPVPTTAGRPYSRQTIAAWLITPPTSVTQAPILAKAGAQDGEVVGATRISPSSNWPTSLTVLHTRALPSTMPGLPAEPLNSVMLSGSLTSCTDAQSASDLLVTPQSTMVKGSWITSGAVPMAGGGLHSLNFCITPLRQTISFGQVLVPRGVTPVAQAVTISHSADLISSRRSSQMSSTSSITPCSFMITPTSRILFQNTEWNQCST